MVRNTEAVITCFVAWFLFCLPISFAQYTPGTGIIGSPHDFSGQAAGSVTTGACTFCHTPHRAIKTRLVWNHTLPARSYSWGPDFLVTDAGTPLPVIGQDWPGPTRFCLSCHDGSVAIGDVAWFNKRAWNGSSAINPTKVTLGIRDPFTIEDFMKDMIGNHPVAAPYPYLRQVNTYNGVTTGAGIRMDRYAPNPTVSSGGRIRLFRNVGLDVLAGASAGITGIECSTCHGVHNERGVVRKVPLLRSDDICKECHL